MRGLNNTNRSLEDFTEHSVVAEKLCFGIPNTIVKFSESVSALASILMMNPCTLFLRFEISFSASKNTR